MTHVEYKVSRSM